MNLYSQMRAYVLRIVEQMQDAGELPKEGLPLDAITVEPPRDVTHGDMATNAAMVLAKPAKKNPREIAEAITKGLLEAHEIEHAEVAGPGFINMTLARTVWHSVVSEVLEHGTSWGNSTIGAGHRINVEYVSANPTGPLHIGHARGAVYGDALAVLLLKAGYDVTKEYYINDAGAQVDVLARSVYLRYREACGEEIGEIPQGLYPGAYVIPVGEALHAQKGDKLLGKDEHEWLEDVRTFAIDTMMEMIKSDLADLGIHHDVFTSEAALQKAGRVPEAIERLRERDLVYRGVLEPPKGKTPEDWEPREQLLFKATEFGDDVDRPLQKSDDSYTYFSGDLALTLDKLDRGFDSLIYMMGADHGGYVKRLKAANDALSNRSAETDVKLCQLVHLFKNGEPVKMSKRAGNFEWVSDVVKAVGKDVLRFVMLTRRSDMTLEFDLDKVQEQSKDNPVFYVQYAHARAQSVLRLAHEQDGAAWEASKEPTADILELLSHEAELAVIKQLASFPRFVEQAAQAHEPHRIAFYLQDLAAAFHGLWNVGQSDADLRFVVQGNTQLTTARLALARAVATGVACGLTILGVEPLDELR